MLVKLKKLDYNNKSLKNYKIEKNYTNNSYNTVSNYVQALVDSYMIYKANRKGKAFLKF